MDAFQRTVFGPGSRSTARSIPHLEEDRNKMELELTEQVTNFNQRVQKQVDSLGQAVSSEVNSLQGELHKEEVRRMESDQNLLIQVNNFIATLTSTPGDATSQQ